MPEMLRRALGVAVAAALVAAAPAAAQEVPTERVEVGDFSSPIRFAGDEGTTTTLDGESRFGEVVEVRPAGSGLLVVNDVSMSTYVEGLAEVPFSWPMEALKAQVVAARTYAWFSIRQGSFGRSGYDICATTACQVYRGRDQSDAAGADRWRRAVAETEGEVLMYGGEPILARYFSTSGGRTRDNEEVFPNEGPRPYLKGVEDPDDEVSPLHTWEVAFPRDRFDDILSRGATLAAAVPVADVRWVDPPTGSDRVVVTGENGQTVEVPASSFRSFVSRVAPELYPEDYPAAWPGRDRRYPTTLMSSRLSFDVREDEVVIAGRGWGHGVGMGQYGAMGKAERGLAYDDILAAYYQGLRPTAPAALPDRVRVGSERTEGPVRLRADRPVPVVVAGRVITERGMGTWVVEARDQGRLALLAPPGFGEPLQVAATASTRTQPLSFERVTLTSVVNKPAEATLEVTTSDGVEVLRQDLGIVEAGALTVAWDLDRADGAAAGPGEYQVRLAATDETGATAGSATAVRVREPTGSDRMAGVLGPAPPVPTTELPWTGLGVALLLGAIAGIGAGMLLAPRTDGSIA